MTGPTIRGLRPDFGGDYRESITGCSRANPFARVGALRGETPPHPCLRQLPPPPLRPPPPAADFPVATADRTGSGIYSGRADPSIICATTPFS